MHRRTLMEKLVILDWARTTGNVAKTCRDFGISRISYYHIKKSVEELALQAQKKRDVSTNCEEIIRGLALADPAVSSQQISEKLSRDHDIRISRTSVHTTLKKLGLNRGEQRWLYLEKALKYGILPRKLSIRQRVFMQQYNPCFGAYHGTAGRPFEQLNLDVIKAHSHRICIAIDPTANYAFALILPKINREKIFHWLDRVLVQIAQLGLPVTTVATSDLKLFNADPDGGCDLFAAFLQKHDLKHSSLPAVRPILDGAIQYLRGLLLQPIEEFLAKQPDDKALATKLTAWLDHYNHRHRHPYYPNYGFSPATMVEYYRKHGTAWLGPRSLTALFRGYINPTRSLGLERPSGAGQESSTHSAIISLFFKQIKR